jgi:hypothetical protein
MEDNINDGKTTPTRKKKKVLKGKSALATIDSGESPARV